MPQPKPRDIKRFCEIDGWEPTTTGKRKTGDHFRYRKELDDGRILRTKASHSTEEIADRGLWTHIWRDQLGLESEEQFWDALKSGKPVDRTPQETERPSGPSLPAHLAGPLIKHAGLSPAELVGMSVSEAENRLAEFYSGLSDRD